MVATRQHLTRAWRWLSGPDRTTAKGCRNRAIASITAIGWPLAMTLLGVVPRWLAALLIVGLVADAALAERKARRLRHTETRSDV